jgi:hypothetical protein
VRTAGKRELMRAAQAATLVNVITRGLSARSPSRMAKDPGDHRPVVVWSGRRVSPREAIYTACRVTNVLRYLDTGNRAGSIFVPIVAVRNEFAPVSGAKKTTRGSIRGSSVVAMYSRGESTRRANANISTSSVDASHARARRAPVFFLSVTRPDVQIA